MLYEIMNHLKNFFITGTHKEDRFVVEGGVISLPFLYDGQYFLIEGSTMNDGVYKYPLEEGTLADEEFRGRITLLAPPRAFLSLCDDIVAYEKKNDNSGFVSESFGGYSYTKATGSNGTVGSWQTVFRERLNTWRKI